jgi:hypothetical protein
MSRIYKRLLNEYSKINEINNVNISNSVSGPSGPSGPNGPSGPSGPRGLNRIKNINYKLHTIESGDVMFRSDINFIYNNLQHNVKIYYNESYPFTRPLRLEINDINIRELIIKIMIKNQLLFSDNCLCCKSLLHYSNKNWNISKNVIEILKEVIKIIDYKQLFLRRMLLNKIISQYTDQNMDYLEKYLI